MDVNININSDTTPSNQESDFGAPDADAENAGGTMVPPGPAEEAPLINKSNDEYDTDYNEAAPPANQGSNQYEDQDGPDIDLNSPKYRHSRWCLTWFIFGWADFTAQCIAADVNSGDTKSGNQLWAASDFFLVIASILGFYQVNSTYFAMRLKFNDRLKYVVGGIFIFCSILRMGALAKHNDGVCHDDWCRSRFFASDFLGMFFSIAFGIDFMLPFCSDRNIRIFCYTSMMLLISVITASDTNHTRRSDDFNKLAKGTKRHLQAQEAGFFFLFFTLLVIVTLVLLRRFGFYAGRYAGAKVMHLGLAMFLVFSMSLCFYSMALGLQTFVALVLMTMVAYDLLWFTPDDSV